MTDSYCRIRTGEFGIEYLPCTTDKSGAIQPHTFANETAVRSFVKYEYQTIMKKYPTTQTEDDYVRQILDDEITPVQFVRNLLFSEEVQSRLIYNKSFVRVLLESYFVESDDAHLNGWTEKLDRGMSREDAVTGFEHSWNFYCELLSLK